MKNILRGVVVLFAVLTAAPVWAQTVSTTYIDENGTSHTVTAKVLTDTTGTFTSDTWYVVNSNVEPSSIGCEGNIKLIIADGKTLDINYGCFGGNNTTSISIYGQTHGTGKLSVNNGNFAIRASGSVNITGCIVEATSDNNHAIICGIGGSTGNITINGGQVTALGGVGKGLSATGTITLGYRKKTDYISAKGFRGTVNIKSGQTLYNGATAYSGNNVGLTGSATLRPFSSNDLSINNTGTEYTIYSATGWNLFCDFLNDNDTYNRFSGKTVRLGANITVTRMAGSDYHDFCGIFDGQGHTITLDGNTTNGCYALFRYDEGTSTWENQKIYSDFALEIGNGYLYRCSEAKTLTYHGEPNMAASYSVALSASGNSDLNGFNLVGNPYNYGITLEIPFYSINADGSWTAHNANETIAMGQAVIVHTNQDVDLIFEAAGKRAYLSNPAAKGPLPALPAGVTLHAFRLSERRSTGHHRHWHPAGLRRDGPPAVQQRGSGEQV